MSASTRALQNLVDISKRKNAMIKDFKVEILISPITKH
jgi:hypothetical protein